jgi:hypothetical protein
MTPPAANAPTTKTHNILIPDPYHRPGLFSNLIFGQGRPIMTADELAASASRDPSPPSDLSLAAQALWLAKAGRWDASHDLCQDVPDPAGSWIHAYLHRVEGDRGNAAYWYSRAGRSAPPEGSSLAAEWQKITEALL